MREGGKRRDESCGLARPLPQILHQEVREESGTGEQVRDRVVRVFALRAGRGGDAADPVKVVTHTGPTRNRTRAVTGPPGGGGEEIALPQQRQEGQRRGPCKGGMELTASATADTCDCHHGYPTIV